MHVTRRLAALVTVVALVGCTSGAEPSAPDQGYVSGDSSIATMASRDRGTPARFAGTTLDGDSFDVREHRGKVVVVNVWGSWCPPCIAEAPDLQSVWAGSSPRDVQFVGINVKDNRAAAIAHEKRFGVTYPSIEDDTGRVLLVLRGSLPPQAIPSTLVLDRDGRVAARVLGRVRAATLRALVADAVRETA